MNCSVYANFEEHLGKASKDCKNEKVKYYIDEMSKACKLYIEKTKNGLVSTSEVKAWTEYFESVDVKGGSTVADLKDFMTSNAFDFKGYFNKKLNRRGDKTFREAMNTFLKKIDKSIDLNSGLPIFDVSRAYLKTLSPNTWEKVLQPLVKLTLSRVSKNTQLVSTPMGMISMAQELVNEGPFSSDDPFLQPGLSEIVTALQFMDLDSLSSVDSVLT